jgi:hypothetical protein
MPNIYNYSTHLLAFAFLTTAKGTRLSGFLPPLKVESLTEKATMATTKIYAKIN